MNVANFNLAMQGYDLNKDVAYLLMENTTRIVPKKYAKVEIEGELIKCYVINEPATKKTGTDVYEISYISDIEDVLGIQFYNTYSGYPMFNDMNKDYMIDY
jgi:hypothetical protein